MKLVNAALFAVLLPTVAAAQNSGVYVQAGPLADWLFTPTPDSYPTDVSLLSSSTTYTWNDLNGDRRWQPGEESSPVLSLGFPTGGPAATSRGRVAAGANVVVGVFVTPSVSLRVEGSFQGEHVAMAELGGAGQLVHIVDRQATSVSDVVVAAGWHQGESRRTTIAYLAGMVFRRERHESMVSYSYLPRVVPTTIFPPTVPGLPLPPPLNFNQQSGATSYGTGVMAGIDVAFNFSKHLAVVPHLRLVGASHTLSIRPGVAMRWRP